MSAPGPGSRRRALAAVSHALVVAGCADPDADAAPDDAGGSQLTFWDDVQPILAARCYQCHLNGPSSYRPWFDSYQHVAQIAGSIAVSAGRREMPPWAVTADGSCGAWDRAHWLGDGELRVLEEWAASDRAEGDRAGADSRDLDPAPLALRRVDVVIDTGVAYQPALGDRLHRCFRTGLALDQPAYMTAFEVVPGNPRAVQHVSLHALDGDAAREHVVALESEDGEPGYHCFGGSRAPGSRLLGTWTWGEAAFRFPAGTGVRLEPGRDVVVQIHYNASGGSATPDPDRTRVELELSASAEEGRFVALELPELALAPGLEFTSAGALLSVPDSMMVHGVFPFMHTLGHSMLLLDSSARCLAEIRHWHLYGHMRHYGYREPLRIDAGDRLWLECSYDTRSRDQVVGAGDGFEAEACRINLYATGAAPRPSSE